MSTTTGRTPAARASPPPLAGEARWAWAVASGLVVAAAVVHWQEGARLSFFYDEWNFITDRRGGGLGAFLAPHNGHASIFPVAWYRVLLEVFGLESYTPYRASVLALHLAAGTLVFALARRRCAPILSLALAALLLFMGSAWQNTLWAFQIGFLGSVVTGLAALLLLDRNRRRHDLGAGVLLAVSVLSSGVGIPFTAAAAVDLLARPRRWARLLVVLVTPVTTYGVWYLRYGESQAQLARIDEAPGLTATGISAAFAGLVGASAGWGRVLAAATAIAAIVAVLTRRAAMPRLAAALAGLLAFYGLTAVSRGAHPDASRYLYVGAVFILLGAAELLRDIEPRPLLTAVVLLAVACGVRANLSILDAGAAGLTGEAIGGRTELAALELARGVVADGYRPDTRRMPTLHAGAYLAAVDDLGSPAYDLDEARRAPDVHRADADRVLIEALGVTAILGPAGPPSEPGACRAVAPGEVVDLPIPAAVVLVDGAAEIRLRRLSDRVDVRPVAVTERAATVRLDVPADRASLAWRVEVSAPARVCPGPLDP